MLQIHVLQEREEATFLQMFDGTLTIHTGKRNQSKQKKAAWRLYVFLGEIDVETHWWELPVDAANLRSRTSFLLINHASRSMLLWHGCATSDERRKLANRSAMKLRERFDRCARHAWHFGMTCVFSDVRKNFISKSAVKISNSVKCKKVMKPMCFGMQFMSEQNKGNIIHC